MCLGRRLIMQSLFFFYCVGLSCDDAVCDAEPLSRRSIRACALWSAACLAQQWSSVEVCDRWALPASTSYIWLTALNMALSHGQAEIRQPSIWFYLCDDTSCVILPFSWSQIYVCLNCSCPGYCCHANPPHPHPQVQAFWKGDPMQSNSNQSECCF